MHPLALNESNTILFCGIIIHMFAAGIMAESSDDETLRRDEVKRKEEAEKLKKKIVEGGCTLLRWVKKHPDLWQDDNMKEFCKLAYEITGDPGTYRPKQEEKGWGQVLIC